MSGLRRQIPEPVHVQNTESPSGDTINEVVGLLQLTWNSSVGSSQLNKNKFFGSWQVFVSGLQIGDFTRSSIYLFHFLGGKLNSRFS